jgi:transposase-like protein
MRTPRKPAKRRASKRNGSDSAPPKKPPRRPAEQPRSLLDFQRMFPDEATCADYMERVRWPDGFACPSCGVKREPFRFAGRPEVLRCRACERDTSLTAGTVMHKSRQPLHTWFWAAYLVTTQTPGMSALQFQRQLGIGRYETAFNLLHKLRAGMLRPDHDPIGDPYPVEVDEAFVGGKTIGKGRGVTDAPLVIAAVEVHTRVHPKTGRRNIYAGRLRLRHIVSRERGELEPFVRENVLTGSTVRTDGCNGYDYLRAFGYVHERTVLGGDADKTDEHLPLVHIVFSNLKTWLRGTHHGVSPQHLQAYLNEYVFRFNRRFYPMTSFASVLGIGTVTEAPTYEGLYKGHYEHKHNPPRDDEPKPLQGSRRVIARVRRVNRR